MKRTLCFLADLILCLCFFVSLGISQTTSTEILGTITDSTGAVVPGAKITLLRVATGERRETASGPTGDYSFPLIEIGEYTVTAQLKGFKTQTRSGITLQLQQKARVDIELTVGEAAEAVEVVATGIQLKTEDVAVGQVVDNKRVVELPLNGRNVASLAVLTPAFSMASALVSTASKGFRSPATA